MTFDYIKKRIAHDIGYIDDSDVILTGKDITEADIGKFVNDRYLNDLFSTLATQYPEDFEIVATAPLYKATGVVDASTTGTTLVATTPIFTNGMVGDTVYNGADGGTLKVVSYTSSTVIEVDSTINDTWDGDTIYVLGTEFAFGGDATDLISVRRVEIKYKNSDAFFRVAQQRDINDLVRYGNETFWESKPFWYNTTLKVAGIPTSALGIRPEPKTNEAVVRVKYVEFPAALSAASDVPRIPPAMHSLLISGGTADAFRSIRQLEQASLYEEKYQREKQVFLANYPLTRQATLPRTRGSNRNLQRLYRTI